MRVIAGVAGKDRRRTLPFPPMWERDGQAPERQGHGPRVQGWPDAWELGSLGTWESGYLVHAPASQPAGYGTVVLYSSGYLGTESTCDCSSPTAYVLQYVPFFCMSMFSSTASIETSTGSRLATHGGLA